MIDSKIIKILIFLIFFAIPVKSEENILLNDALQYLKNLDEFSSSFLQIQNNEISEGLFFIKDNRLRVEYHTPSKLVFILKKNQGMYYNIELQEVQYFNPKNTIGWFLIDLFNDENFLLNSKIVKNEGYFFIYKKIKYEEETYEIKIYFEERPFQIRKFEIVSNLEIISFTLTNPNFNPILNNKIFSLANPLLS